MNKRNGFTIIELLVVATFLIIIAILGFSQYTKLTNESNNAKKRTAINAMHYSLEEGFYVKNGYYPEKLEEGTLPTMDPALLKDPQGKKMAIKTAVIVMNLQIVMTENVSHNKLVATLVDEDDYIKESRHK